MKIKRSLFGLAILSTLVMTNYNVQAQDSNSPFPGLGGGSDDVNDEVAAPIDGFVGMALVAGVLFGIVKLRERTKANN